MNVLDYPEGEKSAQDVLGKRIAKGTREILCERPNLVLMRVRRPHCFPEDAAPTAMHRLNIGGREGAHTGVRLGFGVL